jgi:hypothetical protein
VNAPEWSDDNGPYKYITDKFASCHWHIRAPKGYRIRLKVLMLSNKCDEECVFGFAEIKYRKDMRLTGHRMCCPDDLIKERGEIQIMSESNTVVLSLYSTHLSTEIEIKYWRFT